MLLIHDIVNEVHEKYFEPLIYNIGPHLTLNLKISKKLKIYIIN